MDKYSRYYGLIIFLVTVALLIFTAKSVIVPKVEELNSVTEQISVKEGELSKKQAEMNRVRTRVKQVQDSLAGIQKKVYAPVDSDLEKDTLFFTLYNDVIEMLHANSIKIKSINYKYNPKDDAFVKSGKDYFVCDVDLDLVSNYTNLGKLVQELYQYPYYIKINELDVKPYAKDKKILIANMSLRLYAHTEPVEETAPVVSEE